MSLFTAIGIAIGLAMDALAVAAATSARLARVRKRQIFRLAFHFGLFQALMPAIGWAAGAALDRLIAPFDHWVAFAILAGIGAKMMFKFHGGKRGLEAASAETAPGAAASADPTRGWSLVLLSLATSIDALAMGVSFAMMRVEILPAVLVIGVTAAAFTVAGMLLGSRLGALFGRRMEIAGGAVLVAIGAKILAEHLMVA